MATLNIKNFNKDNTPPVIAKIGNICLLIGSLGAVVAILPLSAPVVTAIGAWVAVAGAVGKILTKFTGQS